ncbi:hypothetical protein [[Pseudomonas] boreopolis]|uniref:hypothetical protein n=1 Tax=Xanthomonas boreopolis TaxID=86183 RepID=UPI003DA12C04
MKKANAKRLRHTSLSIMVAMAMTTGPAIGVHAAEANEDCDADDRAGECEAGTRSSSSGKGKGVLWALGGLALAGAAAGGGGGGGGSSGGEGPVTPPGPGPDPGQGTPGREGGQYGNGGTITGSGQRSEWNGNVQTTVVGRNVRNDGELAIGSGGLIVRNDGELRNYGSIEVKSGAFLSVQNDADVDNHGRMNVAGRMEIGGDAGLDNLGEFVAQGARIALDGEASLDNKGTMRLADTVVTLAGQAEFDNGERGNAARLELDGSRFEVRESAGFENQGAVLARGLSQGESLVSAVVSRAPGEDDRRVETFDNHGTIQLAGSGRVLDVTADTFASLSINRAGGRISSDAANEAMLRASGSQATLVNQGTLTVTGDNAVAMSGANGATLINDGVINLGTAGGSNGSGLVAMQSDGTAVLNNRVGGVINIHADGSHAFRVTGAGSGRIINNGTVNILGKGSGFFADDLSAGAERPGSDLPYQAPRSGAGVTGYTVGTNADGSAGQLVFNEGGWIGEADVDTGFTRGTAATSVELQDVFVGADGGEENVRSRSVVWEAQAQRDEEGNIDVTMTKKAYAGLVGDEFKSLAHALDSGYTNSELFRSLELGDLDAFRGAIRQLSGTDLVRGTRQAVGMGRAFWSALDARRSANGLHVEYFGNMPGLGPNGQGTALRLVDQWAGRNVEFRSGYMYTDRADAASRNDIRSYYFGMSSGGSLASMDIRHGLNYEWHGLETTRSLSFGSTRQQARSDRSLSQLSWTSGLSRSFHGRRSSWQPRIVATAYALHEAAFREKGAGAFGLNAKAVDARGMDVSAGMGWRWQPSRRWALGGDAELIRPLAYSEGARRVSIQGAEHVSFDLPGLKPDGMDYRLGATLDYASGPMRLNIGMQTQRLMGQKDESARMNWSYAF